jgi:hypothetical protein
MEMGFLADPLSMGLKLDRDSRIVMISRTIA